MKASKIHLLFLLTFALGANAATVSVDTVKLAAGSWALSNASLGVPHGTTVSDATPYSVAGTNVFYAVSLEGGGTVFFAADDEIGPVLAFTAESSPDLSPESPLLNLLTRDVQARRGGPSRASTPMLLAANGTSSASAGAVSASCEGERAKKLWAALTSAASDSPARPLRGPMLLGATASPQETLASSDIRVEPILTTQWSQTKDKAGNKCYNYYTPKGYPCGCVATAAGQIMYRWKWPTEELPQFSNSCTVDGATTELDSSGPPRVYYWDAMVDKPGSATSEESRQAIGALLSDLGIAFGADYASDGTGAFEWDVPGPMRTHFKYASAYTYSGRETQTLHNAPMRQRVVLANLDAKRPVELYIISTRAGGHAVVADGYGYVTISGEEVEFTHINMGWAGTDDMWYNLPIIQTKEAGSQGGQTGGYTFEYLVAATFNIHPTETGDLLTGRILEDGEPVEGATVTVYAAGGTEPIANTTSDAHGIYSFCLQGGNEYDVFAVSADGKKTGALANILLMETAVAYSDYTTYSASDVGNSWGNDIDIVIPHVRIVGENNYPSLNAALAAASTMENPVVEIFGPTKLKAPVTITTNVTIRTVPDTSADYPVAPSLAECVVVATDDTITKEEWVLQVADGVRVDFSNIVIRTEANAPVTIDVLETGKAAFSGRVDLGTVTTHAADAFILAGPVEPVGSGLAVSCPFATEALSPFGTYECSDEVATACAQLIANALDLTLIGRVYGGALVWDNEQPISPTIAFAYATNDTLGTRYYLSVDQLFKHYTNGAEVVFLKDCPESMFTNAVVVGKSMTIRSEADTPVVVTLAKDASLTVQGEDTELVLTNIVFNRKDAPATNFATVKEGASLVLASGATIADLQLAGTASAVYVDSGKVTMLNGSAITNCVATRLATGRAGGVYLTGGDCSFDFAGGLITGCVAGHNTGGGAVYAGKDATVYVSGSAIAYGNKSRTYTRNIYVQSATNLILTAELTGEVGVYCNGGTAKGYPFATVEASTADALASREHFHNDNNTSLFAETSEDFSKLVWAAEPPGPKPVPEADAEARLIVGSETNAYASVCDAFEAAGLNDARIELVANASLTSNITVSSAIVFDGKSYTLSRAGDFYLAVQGADASLTVTNIVIYGGSGAGRILNVYGGSLVLDADTVISGVNGSDNTMVAPIVVNQNGTLTMLPGSEISDCMNSFARKPGGPLAAGAVVVTGNSCMQIYGGSIHNCSGSGAGGVYIGNTACAYVQGEVSILDNTSLSGEPSNLVVQDRSVLVLDDMLVGSIGYTEGLGGNTNVFGTVDADFLASTTPSNVAVSAHSFRHDQTRAKGMVATNETEAILVWSSAVGDSTMFTNVVGNVTNVYDVIRIDGDDEPEVVVCEPFAFVAIEEVSPGTWKLTLKPGTEHCVYTLKYSSDLETWTAIGSSKELSSGDISGAELEFFFEVDDTDGKKFWKVEGANGIK